MKDQKKKKILFLQIYGGGFNPGGTEIYLKNFLKELWRLGRKNQLFVLCFNKNNNLYSAFVKQVKDSFWTKCLEKPGLIKFQYKCPLFGLVCYFWGLFWLYQTAKKIIEKENIDLIYSNGGQLTATAAYLLGKKFNLDYILHFHGIFDFSSLLTQGGFSLRQLLFKKISQNYLAQTKQIIVNSRDSRQDVEAINSSAKKRLLSPCFVDEEFFYPQDKKACRRKLGLKQKDLVIVSTNRLEKDKKIELLLESVISLQTDQIKVIFIGNGPLRSLIQSWAKKDKRIVYQPPLSNKKLPLYLNSADICWGACSPTYFGLSLIEALACGRPVMASEVPVPLDNRFGTKVKPETLPSSIGFLVKEEKNYLSRLLLKLTKNRPVLAKKQKACLKFYQQNYGRKNLKKILKLL